jgi:hypothetical protein
MITLKHPFFFGDTYDGQTCWQDEWLYKLVNTLNPKEQIPKERDLALEI